MKKTNDKKGCNDVLLFMLKKGWKLMGMAMESSTGTVWFDPYV